MNPTPDLPTPTRTAPNRALSESLRLVAAKEGEYEAAKKFAREAKRRSKAAKKAAKQAKRKAREAKEAWSEAKKALSGLKKTRNRPAAKKPAAKRGGKVSAKASAGRR